MNLSESLRVAADALGANKLRTGLTLLGVVIGVGAVIALMSIGRGMQAGIEREVQSLGTNLLFITPGAPQQGAVRGQAGQLPTLTAEDAQAILSSGRVPQAVAVAPEGFSLGQVVAQRRNTYTRLTGVTTSFLEVRRYRLAHGQFFTADQESSRAAVAVLGATAARNLFGTADPTGVVGQTIRVNNVTLRVIGILAPKGSQAGGDQDDTILVPLSTLHAKLSRVRTARGGQSVATISVQLTDSRPETIAAATRSIASLLRERHRVAQDDFTSRSQQDLIASATRVARFVTLFLGAVAGISLLVGGIGIMNIMLVSVTERTREIGIRKAVGARPRDVLAQFLTEAVAVSALGGLLGVAAGVAGSRLLNGIRLTGEEPVQTLVALDSVLLAFTVSAGIGLFFGVYPAVKAARLHPIEALRYE
ncbi:MAG TPA: ABC transporter permease [Gemmatimonadaceae bacterium]|nr:ABC transporter permease [Gemmatimonadaceae bacterium]